MNKRINKMKKLTNQTVIKMKNLIVVIVAVLGLTLNNVEAQNNPKQKACNELNAFVKAKGYTKSYSTYKENTFVLHIHSKDVEKLQPSFMSLNFDEYIDVDFVQSMVAYVVEKVLYDTPEAINRFKTIGVNKIKIVLVNSNGKQFGFKEFDIEKETEV
jgi:hypothetical protein